MATVTKTITESSGSATTKATWTLSYTHANVVVSGATFTLGAPTMTAKHVNGSRVYAEAYSSIRLDNIYPVSSPYDSYGFGQDSVSWASGVTKTIPLTSSTQNTYNTSDFFTSSNASSKEVPIHLVDRSTYGESRQADTLYGEFNFGFGDKDWGTLFSIVLNVPPTVTLSTPTYATPHYAGLGAYTVPITSAEAYYDGYISKVTLTVGQDSTVQTYSSATISNETISVTPTMAGTYTPTITVEDSRGQTTTNTLTQIVVNPYLDPSLDFDVFRSNSSGVRDDEGAYGLITANVSFTDAIADITQPTVKINGTTTNNVTWYSAYNASTGVSSAISDWSTVSSGDTIYGLINGSFSQTDSYQITVVLTDSLGGNSSAITQTLSTAFYTIDFQAGGKEIAFGLPANDNLTSYPNGLFKCGMDAVFNGDVVNNGTVTVNSDLTVSGDTTLSTGDTEIENPYFSLDTTASPGTTDGDLYAAIVALGWDSDVIV